MIKYVINNKNPWIGPEDTIKEIVTQLTDQTYFDLFEEFDQKTKSLAPRKFMQKMSKLIFRQEARLAELQRSHKELRQLGRQIMKKKPTIAKKSQKKLLSMDDDEKSSDTEDDDDEIFTKTKTKVPERFRKLNENVYIRIHAEKVVDLIKNWHIEKHEIRVFDKWQQRMEAYLMEQEEGNALILAFTAKQVTDDLTLVRDYIKALLIYLKPFPNFVKDIQRKLLMWKNKTNIMKKIMDSSRRGCTQYRINNIFETKLQEEELESIPLDAYSKNTRKKIVQAVYRKPHYQNQQYQGQQNNNYHKQGRGRRGGHRRNSRSDISQIFNLLKQHQGGYQGGRRDRDYPQRKDNHRTDK